MSTCIRCYRAPHVAGHGYCELHARAKGIIRPFVDRETALAAIQTQFDRGHSIWTLSQAAGLHPTTLYKFFSTRYRSARNMKHTTYEAILNAPLLPITKVPAWPAARRVQALRAAGWGLKELAARTGVGASTLREISLGNQDRCSHRVEQAIREAYERLQMFPVRPASRAVVLERWPLPMEWVNIDDEGERRGLLTLEQKRDQVAVTEELRDAAGHLHIVFGSWSSAAPFVGVHQATLQRIHTGEWENTAREIEHRILHAARNQGWVAPVGVEA